MAKINFGAVITDSRGSINGHTFKWSRYGHVLLPKAHPPKTATTRQSLARADFASLSKRWWSVLTPTQRTDWRSLAAANPRPNVWGADYPLTGLALFISINRRLQAAGLAQTDTAPADQTVTAPATATLTIAAAATVSIAWTTTPLATDHILIAYMTGPRSPGATNFDHGYSYIAASAEGQGSPWSISSAFLARFGAILTGRQYGLHLATFNTANGAQSPSIATAAIAT